MYEAGEMEAWLRRGACATQRRHQRKDLGTLTLTIFVEENDQ